MILNQEILKKKFECLTNGGKHILRLCRKNFAIILMDDPCTFLRTILLFLTDFFLYDHSELYVFNQSMLAFFSLQIWYCNLTNCSELICNVEFVVCFSRTLFFFYLTIHVNTDFFLGIKLAFDLQNVSTSGSKLQWSKVTSYLW